jgi:hypothetical protein
MTRHCSQSRDRYVAHLVRAWPTTTRIFEGREPMADTVTTRLSEALVGAVLNTSPAQGLTHGFYHYPARFSPAFVRAAIAAFSQPGDVVLDPFMGSATTLVESLVAGRHAIGSDINTLAHFLAQVKTTPLAPQACAEIAQWASSIPERLLLAGPRRVASLPLPPQHAPSQWGISWSIRQTIAHILAEADQFPTATATKSRALCAAAHRTMGIGLHLHAPVCTCISSAVCRDPARVPQRTHRVARDARAGRWRHDSAGSVSQCSCRTSGADPLGTRYWAEAHTHPYLASLSECACALPSLADQEPKRGDDSLLDYRSTRWTWGSLLYDGEPDFNRTRQLFQRHRVLVCAAVPRGRRERSRRAVARLLPE